MGNNERYAALYIRVSTDMQTDLSPDAQKRELINYAKTHNYIVKKEFIFMEEQGISGKHAEKRPAFQKMIAVAKLKPKPFEAVLVWKFSRFARNQEESTFYKGILRKKCSIDVISISEPITEGMFGRLIELIIEWNDEYYSYNLANEVMRGMTEKALRGGYQAKPPLGYTLDASNHLVIIPKEAEIIKLIFHLFVDEASTPFEIARYLNQSGFKTSRNNHFENRSVIYILSNPIYIGKIRWNRTHHASHQVKDESEWIISDGDHEPIITNELFNAAAQRLNRTRRKYSRPAATYSHWLSGIVKCSNCGKVLTATKAFTNQYETNANNCGFQCYGYAKGTCLISHYISANKLTNALFQSMEAVLQCGEVEFTVSQRELRLDNQSMLTAQLEKLKVKEKRAKNAYINEIDTLEEYQENKLQIQNERRQIQKLLDNQKELTSNKAENRNWILQNFMSTYDLLKDDKIDLVCKNEAVKNVIYQMIYNKKEGCIDIFYYMSSPSGPPN